MPTKVEADLTVQRFGFLGDGDGNRFVFPHAEGHGVSGRTGSVRYGAADLAFDELEGHLGSMLWRAVAASLGKVFLKDDNGKVDLTADRLEMPRGVKLVRAEKGVEILAHHVSLTDMALVVNGPFGSSAGPAKAPTAADSGTFVPRQERLRFLDSLSGRIYTTLKVTLDLPVIGRRTLDQELKLPIQEGSISYRGLEEQLDWLEGQFLDIKHEDEKLAVTWRVPIFGSSHDLISWSLDRDAQNLAAFGKVPVRSLTEFTIGSGKPDKDDDDEDDKKRKKKRKVLESFVVDGIDIALNLTAPRNLDVGGGTIMFGGENEPGLVDLAVTGSIRDAGAGQLTGKIGSLDTTIKDLKVGPVTLSADRLCLDGLDQVEIEFDGFKPVRFVLHAHRVTATNLVLRVG